MDFKKCCESAETSLPQLKPADLVSGRVYTITARKIVHSPHNESGKSVLVTFGDTHVYFLPARFQNAFLNNPDSIPMKEGEKPTRLRFIEHKPLKYGKTTPIFEILNDPVDSFLDEFEQCGQKF